MSVGWIAFAVLAAAVIVAVVVGFRAILKATFRG